MLLHQKAAEKANKKITEVVVGNVEEHMLPWPPKHFDALIMSEVLEHLEDPWATLRRLRPLLKPNALVFASSPNVSHHRVIRMMIKGEWHLADLGVMDRTHLRWFTPKTYKHLFESCGYIVDSIGEKEPLTWKAKVVSFLTFNHYRHLFVGQINLKAHCL